MSTYTTSTCEHAEVQLFRDGVQLKLGRILWWFGPPQLALAILLDCVGPVRAARWHQDFRREYVVGEGHGLVVSVEEILNWVDIKEAHA